MQAPDPKQLKWLRPSGMSGAQFAQIRPALERVVGECGKREIYSVNTRSIYRADDRDLGEIALKEIRFETALKRFRATWLRRHRILCEFHAAAAFANRGGVTPNLFGAALEFRGPHINRVFSAMEWLDDARSLSESIRSSADAQRDALATKSAEFLFACARLGFVHGRHSSENILVTRQLAFNVIDFSHAQLFTRYCARGFTRDVARIGARLILENACDWSWLKTWCDAIAHEAADGTLTAAHLLARIERTLRKSKRRQRIERGYHTFWRGFRFRLRA
jgi:hypothetical protein